MDHGKVGPKSMREAHITSGITTQEVDIDEGQRQYGQEPQDTVACKEDRFVSPADQPAEVQQGSRDIDDPGADIELTPHENSVQRQGQSGQPKTVARAFS